MLNTKTTIILLLISSATLLAQTPSEIRKQKMKEKESEQQINGEQEKLTPSQIRAQKEQNQKSENIFDDNDPGFKTIEVPDKWKNESAVILYQKTNYNYLIRKESQATNMGSMPQKFLVEEVITRKKIKLLDKASIEAHSEFYYLENGPDYLDRESSSMGIKIIKANGSKVDVDLKKAVPVTADQMSQKYGIRNVSKDYTYKKIAVPDLQIGDIIDYFSNSTSLYFYNKQARPLFAFQPYTLTLNVEYPIVKQGFNFNIGEDIFFNFNSYNGAPKLVETSVANSKDKSMSYTLESIDREKNLHERWTYENITLPTIKFQALLVNSDLAEDSKSETKMSLFFVGKTGKVNSLITENDIQTVVSRNIDQKNVYNNSHDNSKFTNYLKKRGDVMRFIEKSDEKDPEKILQLAYYYIRYLNASQSYNYDKFTFTSTMLKICEEYKIKVEVFAAMDKEYGTIKDVLFLPELTIGVVAHLKGKDIFFSTPNDFSIPGDISPEIQGSEGIIFTPTSLKGELKNKKIVIPTVSYSDNSIVYNSTVILDEQLTNLTVKRKNTLSGLCKVGSQPLALYATSYILNDKKKLEGDEDKGNQGRIAEGKRKEEEKNKEHLLQLMNKMKNDLKDDFDVVSYDKFELLSDGRYDESPKLSYDEIFTIKNLVNKAGKNYVFDIGKLIGAQLELSEIEKKRGNDIFFPFPKSFTNELTVTLPSGYTAEGLSDLNFNVDNESGSFISTAKIEGNKIIIKTVKNYKKSFDKKENWPKLLEALESAYKFTQKKIIIKKV